MRSSLDAGVVMVATLLGVTSDSFAGSALAKDVWQWFGPCPADQVIEVEVRVDDGVIYEERFPACSIPLEENQEEVPKKILEFKFHESAARFGEEYRDLGVIEIEGNIWRAGGEPDGILLGVSFVGGGRVLLNTLHPASATEWRETGLVDHIVIATSPVERSDRRDAAHHE